MLIYANSALKMWEAPPSLKYTHNLSESTTWTLLDNDESILNEPFANVGFCCGFVKSRVRDTIAPVGK